MDTLKNKKYESYAYTSRYTSVPYYYDTLKDKEVYGIGTRMFTDTEFVTHVVKETDDLDYLALKYYGNPSLWWVIAYFNNIQDAFVKLSTRYSTLNIPSLASISFGDER